VARAKASIELPAQVSAAERLWYDVGRWASFVDGFHHAEKVEGDWPEAGSRVRWASTPDGRGLVDEHVVHYEVRAGQTVQVEDPKMLGTQTVTFTPKPEGHSQLTIELDYRIKGSGPFNVLTAFFVKRAFADSMKRTLGRFRRELQGELALEDAR
jgi:Polyketide cyclase / dehydrase and lipid transport